MTMPESLGPRAIGVCGVGYAPAEPSATPLGWQIQQFGKPDSSGEMVWAEPHRHPLRYSGPETALAELAKRRKTFPCNMVHIPNGIEFDTASGPMWEGCRTRITFEAPETEHPDEREGPISLPGEPPLTAKERARAEAEGAASGQCPFCEGGMDAFAGVHTKECPLSQPQPPEHPEEGQR